MKECEKKRKKASKFIKENPVEATIIAGLAGFFAGKICNEMKNFFKK